MTAVTTTPLTKLAEQLVAAAADAADFGHEPILMPYNATRESAGRIRESATRLMAEIQALESTDPADPATMSRRATAVSRLRVLAQELSAVWQDHHNTAEENDDLIEDYVLRSADLSTMEAAGKLEDLSAIVHELEQLSVTNKDDGNHQLEERPCRET